MDTREAEGGPIASTPSLWEDILWDQLLANIERERVIPIVGPALSTVQIDGQEMTLERFVTDRLAARLGVTPTDDLTLGGVVARYLHDRRQISDLYGLINSILLTADLQPPEALRKLASIRQFKLFVTTSFDCLLEAALNAERFEGRPVTQSLGYDPKEYADCDISPNLRRLRDPIVYHLLGKVSALDEYVISDDDLLEYICKLQEGSRPEKLFDALRDNNLLLLGGTFSDWLVRLFLRMIKGQRLSYPRAPLEIMADERTRSDTSLVSFLTNFSQRTRVFHASAPEFIDELWLRCHARFGAPVPEPAPSDKGGAVFISYARQDQTAAARIHDQLKARGYSVWFDDGTLKGGQAYDDIIDAAIKDCRLFFALLSKAADKDVRDAYFRREWTFAAERDTRNAPEVTFIVPLVIDRTSRSEFRNLPRRFAEKHILPAPDGVLGEEAWKVIEEALGGRS